MNHELNLTIQNIIEKSLAPIWERLFSIEETLFTINRRMERVEALTQSIEPKK